MPVTTKKTMPGMVSHAVLLSVLCTVTSAPASAAEVKKTLPTVTVEASSIGSEGYNTNATAASSPKYTAPLLDTPQTINIVPQEVLEDQGVMSLRDVTRNITGVTAAAGEGGNPAGDNLTIRGFNAQNDIFVDGIRDIGGYFRDSFNMEQVEVVKGPGSTYTGRGSTGGIVNLVSKTPTLENRTGGEVTVGTDNLTRATSDMNYTIPGFEAAAVRLNAMVHDEEVAGRDVVENSRWGIAPSVGFGIGQETELTLSYFHQQEDNIPDYGHPYFSGVVTGGTVVSGEGVTVAATDLATPIAPNRDAFYGLVNRDYMDTTADIVTAEIRHELSDSQSIRNATRYGRSTIDTIVTPPRDPDPFTNTMTRNGRDKDSTNTILVNQTDLTSEFATGSVNHTLVTGVEFGREDYENFDRDISSVPGNLFNPNPYDPFTGTITPGDTTETDANSQAIYAFDTAEINNQWSVNGGLRWDRFDAESTDTAGLFLSQTDTFISWRGGVVYKPQENGSIYAAYGTSFNPTAESLRPDTGAINLDPEESQTYEVGTKWELLKERLGLNLAIFRTEKTNARTEDPVTGFDVLAGEQRVDGFEIGITGQVTEQWQVFAGYTYLTSEVESSLDPAEVGKDVNRTPENSIVLWTTYDLTDKATIGGGMFYIDDRFSNNTNTNLVEGATVFDAMASYDITENVELRLNITNLFDEEYYDSVGGGHAIPGRGRTAMLTTAFEF